MGQTQRHELQANRLARLRRLTLQARASKVARSEAAGSGPSKAPRSKGGK